MKKKTNLLVVIIFLISVLFASCQQACSCRVEWREDYDVGTVGNYRTEYLQDYYFFYPEGDFSNCDDELRELYSVIKAERYYGGVTGIHCEEIY